MNNAELIKALRYCKDHEQCEYDASAECPYEHHWTDGEDCQNLLLADAAAALEAAEKRIAELMPKEGEWIMCESEKPYIVSKCSVCGGMSSECGYYCPNCGARMKGENDEES